MSVRQRSNPIQNLTPRCHRSERSSVPLQSAANRQTRIMHRLFIALIVSAVAVSGFAPQSLTHQTSTNNAINPSNRSPREEPTKLFERRDASRSGTKRERLDRLAELEESRIETDKSVVLKGAGAFVGLIILLLIVAGATGVLDPITSGGY